MAYFVGIDIGGTFTDVVLLDDSGTARLLKTPTTPPVSCCRSRRERRWRRCAQPEDAVACQIGRHLGVVRVTFRAPVDRLDACGLLPYAIEQCGPTPSGGRPVGGSDAGGGAEGTSAARPGGEDGTVPSGA